MRLQVEARLDYDFHGPVEALLHLEVAHWPGQRIVSEQLSLDPPIAWSRQDDPATGERRLVFAHAGPLKIDYQALVDLDPADHALTGAAQATVASLPVEALPYLRPSPLRRRYSRWAGPFRGRSSRSPPRRFRR